MRSSGIGTLQADRAPRGQSERPSRMSGQKVECGLAGEGHECVDIDDAADSGSESVRCDRHGHAAAAGNAEHGALESLELDRDDDVLHMRRETNPLIEAQMRSLAESRRRRRVDTVTASSQSPRDLAPLPPSTPGAVNDHEGAHRRVVR